MSLLGVFVALSLVMACGSDSTSPSAIEITFEPGLVGFEARLDSLRVELRIPGMAAAIVSDGQIVWSRGFGLADAGANRPATPQTPFHLASLTKTFAATIVMQLVEQGLVDLDDRISRYGIDLGNDEIRVRHLINHTSEGVPGSRFSYNGSRFNLLDYVIEEASGHSFAELLVEQILQPLQLRNTAPNPGDPEDFDLTGFNRSEFVARMARGYELDGSTVVPVDLPHLFGTAAGLVASAEDYAVYSIAIDQGRFLQPETWDSVFTPAISNDDETLPYAIGWFIYRYQGVNLQWHYGWWTGNSSLIVRAPEQGLAFVVLANSDMLSRAYGLGGDANVMRSDVARLFIESYVLGDGSTP
ncbi:MAG TPA: serine hydrolase domain-containing protein [Gemmatimonadota bacterium]|nr:serine hydrolase domain-containing protein [Gemmatimonadota bacterium]